MEKREFNRYNAELLIPCPDESDFRAFCGKNGIMPYQFKQSDGWQGLYAASHSGEMVYYFGDEVMRFYGNN